MAYEELVGSFKKYWHCQPAYEGRGGPCKPSAAHQANYGCGWRWWASLPEKEFSKHYMESNYLDYYLNKRP